MNVLAVAVLALVSVTALSASADLGVPGSPDHYLTNRAVLVAAWQAHVDMPLGPDAVWSIERVAAATRQVDLQEGTPVHAGTIQITCSSPSNGCNLDTISGLPPDQCITAQHFGLPGFAHQWVTGAATASHSDGIISNHGHQDGYVAGLVCVRNDASNSVEIRADGVGVFL